MMAAIPAVLMYASAALSAAGAMKQSQAAASAAQWNAKRDEQNAANTILQGEAAADMQRRDAQRRLGAAVASFGASGVEMDVGSPTDVLADSARQAELDNLTTKYNYKLKALGYSDQAALGNMSADNYRTAGYLSAVGSLAGSTGRAIPMFGG